MICGQMQTKIVYVLTSNGNDSYTAMLCLSLHTLRTYNRAADVLVVMDDATRQALEEYDSPILKAARAVVVAIPAEYDRMQRSRYLKTSLRDILEGDFLYLDVDTLIADRLDEIDQIQYEIALVADRNLPLDYGIASETMKRIQKIGLWNLVHTPTFNGGVMFVRDTLKAHSFFKAWHKNWNASIQKGVSQDQPALWAANEEQDLPIQELPGCWNFQYKPYEADKYRHFMADSKILHYYTVLNKGRILTFLLNRVQNHGNVDALSAAIVHFPRMLVRIYKLSVDFGITKA